MPYIKKDDRLKVDAEIDALVDAILKQFEEKSGVLNYAITRLLTSVLSLDVATRYANLNCAAGVLECVKLELYRRIAAKYEDTKVHENGDVLEYKQFEDKINNRV